jgi:hypothetical protein
MHQKCPSRRGLSPHADSEGRFSGQPLRRTRWVTTIWERSVSKMTQPLSSRGTCFVFILFQLLPFVFFVLSCYCQCHYFILLLHAPCSSERESQGSVVCRAVHPVHDWSRSRSLSLVYFARGSHSELIVGSQSKTNLVGSTTLDPILNTKSVGSSFLRAPSRLK